MLPTPVLDYLSPYEKLFSTKPNYSFLKGFGFACYLLLRPYNHHKFDFHSSLCLFLGYDAKRRDYLCLTTTGKLLVSHNVLFNESLFLSIPSLPMTLPPIRVYLLLHLLLLFLVQITLHLLLSLLHLASRYHLLLWIHLQLPLSLLHMCNLLMLIPCLLVPKLVYLNLNFSLPLFLMIFLNHLIINKPWLTLIGFVP